MPTETSIRFRTLADAGKYAAAMLYPAAQQLPPELFGAVSQYIENPEWDKAGFTVIEYPKFSQDDNGQLVNRTTYHAAPVCLPGEDDSGREDIELKTAAAWYEECPFVIVCPDGFGDDEVFNDVWYHTPMSKAQFDGKLGQCILL